MSGVMCSLVLLVVFAALAVLRARPLTLAVDCQFGLVQAWVSVISLIPFTPDLRESNSSVIQVP